MIEDGLCLLFSFESYENLYIKEYWNIEDNFRLTISITLKY